MTGHQCIQGHHFNIRESSYFKLLFINQQAPKWILWLFTVGQNIKLALVERLSKVQFGLSNGNGFLKTSFPEKWPMS